MFVVISLKKKQQKKKTVNVRPYSTGALCPCSKCALVNIRQVAVCPVPVSATEEPVLGAGVGVLALFKPPENKVETSAFRGHQQLQQ